MEVAKIRWKIASMLNPETGSIESLTTVAHSQTFQEMGVPKKIHTFEVFFDLAMNYMNDIWPLQTFKNESCK